MLSVARVLKSDGTDGGVLVGFRELLPEELDCKEPVFVFFDGLPVPFFIRNLHAKGAAKAVVHLHDVNNLKDAEELVGKDLYIEETGKDELSEETDFAGWILLDKGSKVGEITGIEPIPGNICLCVGDALVPLHEDLIISCDKDKKELDMTLPEGLLPNI